MACLMAGLYPALTGVWMQAAAPSAGGNGLGLLMILAIFAVFYFLIIMPVQRKQKRVQKMHRELKAGDQVITSGGMRGTILSIKDDSLMLRVAPDQLKIEFVRAAIAQVINDEAAGASKGRGGTT